MAINHEIDYYKRRVETDPYYRAYDAIEDWLRDNPYAAYDLAEQ